VVNERDTLSYRFVATDPDGPESGMTWSVDTPNPGISINPSTGRLRWITGEEDGGTTTEVTVTVTDGALEPLSDSITLDIEVLETNSPPTLAAPGSYAIDVGEPLSVQLSATDGDLPAQVVRYRFAGGQPAGMTLDPVGGLIQWTPADEHEEATFSIQVQAYDDQVPEAVATRTLYVEVLKNPGLPPEFDPFPALVWETDGVNRVDVSAIDPEGEPVTVTADLSALTGGWPSFRAGEGSGTATLAWGTWGVAPGTYAVPLTAATDRQSVTAELTIEIVARAAYSGYPGWAVAYGLVGADAAIDASLNPSGMENLLVYALGLDPRGPVAPGQPGPWPSPLGDVEGLLLTVPEGGLGRPDVEYVVERSIGDAGSWQPIATKAGHAAWTGLATTEQTPLEGDLTELRVVSGGLPPAESPVLLRLRANLSGGD
jgi:hypothetical protein